MGQIQIRRFSIKLTIRIEKQRNAFEVTDNSDPGSDIAHKFLISM